MKQFDLEEYKRNPSRKIVTRDGRPVRIVCTDLKGDWPILFVALDEYGNEYPFKCMQDGVSGYDHNELFFDSVRKEGWMNIFKHGNDIQNSCIYDTEDEAEAHTARGKNSHYITTIKVEWEEEQE